MRERMDNTSKALLWILSLSVILIIAISTYRFLYLKDYEFYVETSCDPTSETCFFRDCEEEECPPNGLGYYKTYLINATDFSKCLEEDCTDIINSGQIEYEEFICGESEEDVCSAPEEILENLASTDEEISE